MDIKQVAGPGVGAVSQPSAAARGRPALPTLSAPTPAPTPGQVEHAVAEIQRSVGGINTNLRFSVDDRSGRTVVTVTDSETREVIRQIPNKEVMEISRALDRMQGLLLNGTA